MSGSAILTNNGLLKIASASPLDQLTITQIAIGDGVNPLDPNSTALVNEVYRDAASTPIRSTTYPNTLVFELNIPPTTGGFTCREIGAFDTDGDLIAVGTLDELVKPTDGINYVARINVKLANAAQVDVFYDNQGAIDHSGLRNRDADNVHTANAIEGLEFDTVAEAVAYTKIDKLVGRRVWIGERRAYFNVVLTSSFSGDGEGKDELTSLTNATYGFALILDSNKIKLSNLGAQLGAGFDNSPFLQRAYDILDPRGTIENDLFNPYFSSSVLIEGKPVSIVGVGALGNYWTYTGTDDFLTIKNLSRTLGGSTPQEWSPSQKNGFYLSEITIEGNSRQNIFDALVFLGENDDIKIESVNMYNVKGSCIRWGDRSDSTSRLNMRESEFKGVEMKNCGYSSGVASTSRPVCDMYKDAGNGADNFNNITFDTFEIVYPRWKGFVIENNFTTNQFRKFKFLNCFFHGNKSLSGNDSNGEAWSNSEDLIEIIAGTGAECREIEFIDSKLLEHQDSSAGIHCGDNSGISWKGGTIEGYSAVTPSRVGIRFESANTSFVGDITSQAENFGKGVVDIVSMNTNNAVSLGYFSRFDNTLGAATVTTTSDQSLIEDLNSESHVYTKLADASALDEIPLTPVLTVKDRRYIKSFSLILESAVAQDAVDNAVFSVLILNPSGATIGQVDIDTATTSVPSRTSLSFPQPTTKLLPTGSSLAVRITKQGAGVSLPSGSIVLETSKCVRYIE